MPRRGRSATWILIAIAIAFTLIGAWFAQRADEKKADALDAPTIEAGEPPTATVPDIVAADTPREVAGREHPRAPETEPAAKSSSGAVRGRTHGLVLALDGDAIAGLVLVDASNHALELARTDARGAFELDGSPPKLALADTSWTIVRDSPYVAPEELRLLVVAHAVRVEGRVRDPSGRPLAGANVSISIPMSAFARFTRPLDKTATQAFRVTTPADGTFAFPAAPSVDHGELVAALDGYATNTQLAPTQPASGLVIVLEPDQPAPIGARMLAGVVVLPDGSPASGARVLIVDDEHAVDDRGAFRFAAPNWVPAHAALAAVARDHRAAMIKDIAEQIADPRSQLENLRLVLGDAPLSIAGRVIDADGKPCAGWSVSLHDATALNDNGVPPRTIENAVSGASEPSKTKSDGSFSIGGLFDREYRVQAWSSELIAKVVSEPILAGRNDVTIRVPADARVRLFGRVVGRDGNGVAGAEVRFAIYVDRTENAYSSEHSKPVKTADDGSFDIASAPRHFGYIDVGGDGIVPVHVEYEERDLSQPIVVEVSRRCHFRVADVPATSGATSIQMRDARGQALPLTLFQAGMSSTSSTMRLQAGVTSPLAVPEEAVTIVFFDKDDIELAHHGVTLVPGEVTVVRW